MIKAGDIPSRNHADREPTSARRRTTIDNDPRVINGRECSTWAIVANIFQGSDNGKRIDRQKWKPTHACSSGRIDARRTVHLGKLPMKAADTIKGRIEAIVAAQVAQASFDRETAEWIGKYRCQDCTTNWPRLGCVPSARAVPRRWRHYIDRLH